MVDPVKSSKEDNWYVAHLYNADSAGLKIEAKKKLNDDELDALQAAAEKVDAFPASQNVVDSVYANRNDVLSAIVTMAKKYSDEPRNAEEIMSLANLHLSRLFANMCSMFKSFIDHLTKYFANNFGNNSDQYVEWIASQRREYDGSLAYRIVSITRDYIQHRDMPPLSIGISEKSGVEGFATRVDIDIKKLSEDQKMKKLKTTGNENLAKIPLFRVIDDWSECFRRLSDEVTEIRARTILNEAQIIASIRDNLKIPTHGRIAIIRLPPTDGTRVETLNLNIQNLPEEKAKSIVQSASYAQKPTSSEAGAPVHPAV